MTIWVVRAGFYKDFCAAFSSHEKAAEWIKSQAWDEWFIDEFNLDPEGGR